MQLLRLQIIASTPNFLYANQTELPLLSGDILKQGFTFKDGCLEVPDKVGLGVELDWSKVEKYARIYAKITPPTEHKSFSFVPRI